MDSEEVGNAYTPRGSRKGKSTRKLTSLGKAIRKRLPKTPKSERAGGSISGSDSGAAPHKKLGSLSSRLKQRFSSAGATPRRSFSAADLSELGKSELDGTIKGDNEEVVAFTDSATQSEDYFNKATTAATPLDSTETEEHDSIVHPDTPAPGERSLKEKLSDGGRSAASQPMVLPMEYTVGMDSGLVVENIIPPPKVTTTEDLDSPTIEPTILPATVFGDVDKKQTGDPLGAVEDEYFTQGVQLINFPTNERIEEVQNEELTDAIATVEEGIEETLEFKDTTVLPETNKVEDSTTTEMVGTTEEKTTKEEEDIEIVSGSSQTREIVLSSMIEQEIPKTEKKIEEEEEDKVGTKEENEIVVEESKEIVKPRKHRFRPFRIRAASLSLAALTVGLLMMVIKAKH